MENHAVTADYTNFKEIDNVKVFVRLRPPPLGSEVKKVSELEENRGIALKGPNQKSHKFKFDQVFNEESDQANIHKVIGTKLVDKVLQGYNTCCFAYGQTGSGKTHSIFGAQSGPERGLLTRVTEYLFERIKDVENDEEDTKIKVEMTFMEMYCDQIRDLGAAVSSKPAEPRAESPTPSSPKKKIQKKLLQKRRRETMAPPGVSKSRKNLSTSDWFTLHKRLGFDEYAIHEDPSGHIYVKDAATLHVTSTREVNRILHAAFKLRATHGTS